jgi:hypothetical protein
MNEKNFRKTAALVGALFIIATATSIVSMAFLGNALDGNDYLLHMADHKTNVAIAAVFETALAISVLGIGALMLPILRKQVEGLGVAYAGIRAVEAVFIVLAAGSLLIMVAMGQDFASGHLDAAGATTMGALLLSLRDISLLFGTLLFLSFGGLVLNYLLYISRLVPRWLSAWGLIGDVCLLTYGILGVLGSDTGAFNATALLAAPIAVQEMAFALWLILKGFASPEVAQ